MTDLEIRADGIGVDAGGRTVLDNVDLRATAGRVVGLSGPSGSGKTTLLHVLAGILRPTRGHVTYLGGLTDGFGPARAAVVLQGFGLAPTLTATENIALPLLAAGRSGAAAAEPCDAALARFGLTQVSTQLVGDLSGGQRQRVAVARAVARRAELILADEPTAAVDTAWRDTILEVLGQEADRGAIVLIASHDPDVLAVCTEVIELADGKRIPPPQME